MKLNKTEKFVLDQPKAWHQTALDAQRQLHAYTRKA